MCSFCGMVVVVGENSVCVCELKLVRQQFTLKIQGVRLQLHELCMYKGALSDHLLSTEM
jgi:hypothetical protein